MTPATIGTKPVPLRLCLLGSFHLKRGERTIQFPTRKVESLFAYLALFSGQHSREQLAALLWGDSIDEQARSSLRTALAVIRKELGEDILIADRETVQLNPGNPIWVDTRAFEQLAADDPQLAISLYQNNLLPDFFDDWIAPERERLRSHYLDTLLQLTQQHRAKSEYARD